MTLSSKKRLLLIGARIDGQAGVVLNLLSELRDNYELVGFLDNTPSLQGTTVGGFKVLGTPSDAKKFINEVDSVHISIGDNVARLKIAETLIKDGFHLETLIHPTAYVASNVKIGSGTFVGPKSIINCGASLGKVCLINSGAIVEHDNLLGDAVHFAPKSCSTGRVRIGEAVFIGAGAVILPDVEIGENAMVGAGAVVTKNVEKSTTMIGYAAKKHERNIYKDLELENTLENK